MDAFFQRTPNHVWQEYKIAAAIIDSYDSWLGSVWRGNKKPWNPPEFKAKPTDRRRLSGGTF